MITKENFYKIFPFIEEENFKSQIYEKYLLAVRNNQYSPLRVYLSPKYWVYLEDFCKRESIPYLCEGFFEEAERRLFSFNYYPGDTVPGTVIIIKNKSKFRTLYHKDYLGAILGLGFDRNTIGDIIVHIFNKEDRLFYDLERLWRDAISVSKEQLGIKEAAL